MTIHAVVSRLTTGIPEEEWDDAPEVERLSLPQLARKLSARPEGATREELAAAYTASGRPCAVSSVYQAVLELVRDKGARTTRERNPQTRRWVTRYFL